MAYRCPVCEDPQVDAGHLANHVAFTAVIRGGDHEAWLDEHVPEWDEDDEETLARRLLDLDEIVEIDHPIDASGEQADDHDHQHGHGQQHQPAGGGRSTRGAGALDADAQRILDEAQELTQQMQGDEADGDSRADDSEGETE